jgi:hypothetical protein
MAQLEEALLGTLELALLEQLEGDLNYIIDHQEQVVQTLGGVIDKILSKRGFALEELVLEPGEVTIATVKLHLAEALVAGFEVQFNLLGNTPVIQTVVAADAEAVAAELYATVARTPYDDARWITALVSETVARSIDSMPDYRDFDRIILVQPGVTTQVSVSLNAKPEAQVVTEYISRVRSHTMLNVSLAPARDQVAHYLQSLRGAPVSFISANLGELERALYQHLVNRETLGRHCAEATLVLALEGCRLNLELWVDSERTLLGFSGRLDSWEHGEPERVGRISARGGILTRKRWTAYAAADYFPGSEGGYPMLGIGRVFHAKGFLGAGYDFKADTMRFQATHDLDSQFYLKADLYAEEDYEDMSEFSLHYLIRDIYELQLVSNFDGEVYAAIAANL